ncbi:methionyl-tRNA formyltransferase [Insolitispirillum peregrinum]|uniref:Methionyl-tRNA formyltransferase n=1 Tax=Insolitispirillum peregrinum TaxID=80876 RepID=A0A1N7QAT1_9PROT|nr:methionyl-tRNA formyltransferase [Insolitispirillum peregrinum]SIT19914.1 methionyl-tRNA formyltransferase [Insolitispirillum peregrinum]
MRVVFMGTPDFAACALDAVVSAGHQVVAVYSQPPRPAGRGQKERPSPVQARAEALGLEVRTPTSLRTVEAQQDFAALQADIAVVAAYGLILPQAILDAPRLGCINIHGSLLPRWRGAAPIQRAIMAGDAESGITIMQMEAGLDTGPMLTRESLPITPTTTAASLHDQLAEMGARMVVEALDGLAAGRLTATPQPAEGVTYAAKIDKAEAHIDWSRPASDVARHINGLSPFPGAWCEVNGERVKILLAEQVAGHSTAAAGTLVDERLLIACGDGGAVRLLRLQRSGKAPLEAEALLRGWSLPAGTVLA